MNKLSFEDIDNIEISASEINKYMYCNYSWYYNKIYGQKYLASKRKELNELRGYTNTRKSNFAKGKAFHDSYYEKKVFKRKLIRFIIILVILVVIFLSISIGVTK